MKNLVFLVLVLTACGRGSEQPTPSKSKDGTTTDPSYNTGTQQAHVSSVPRQEGVQETVPSATYALNVKPLLDAHCVTCHGVGGQKPELHSYAVIANTDDASKEAIVVAVKSGRMPMGSPLPTEQRTTIENWGRGGFLQ